MSVKISDTSPKTVRVAGEVVVRWEAKIPVDRQHEAYACEDPAVEVVLAAVNENVDVFLWGRDEAPANVYLEVSEEDVTIEEDDR